MTHTAIVLAGGLGTRLRTHINDVPKPMAPINGSPFLEHLLDYWISEGIKNFIISVGYKAEIIIDHFGDHYKDAQIQYAKEETPLGTGGGLLLASSFCTDQDKEVIALNGDTYFRIKLDDIFEFHQSKSSDRTFGLFITEESNRYLGIELDEDARVQSIKSSNRKASFPANGGIYMFKPSLLNSLPWSPGDMLSLEDQLLTELQQKGSGFYGMISEAPFIDIGIPADFLRSSEVILRNT